MTLSGRDRSVEDAIRLMEAEQLQAALEIFAELTLRQQTAATAHGYIAWIYRIQGRYEDAVVEYDAVLQLEPANHEAQLRRAQTLLALGGPPIEATRVAIQVLQVEPLNPLAAHVLREAQQAAGIAAIELKPRINCVQERPGPTVNRVADLLENSPSTYPASICPEVGRLLYALVRCIRPSFALETGCYIGYSTVVIAQALEDNQHGHLHSFDLFPQLDGYESPVAGKCGDTLIATRQHLESAGLSHRSTLHRGDSSANIGQLAATAPESVQFAFIDGDHTIRGCLRDFVAVDRALAAGGIVVLHDTVPEKCAWLGPAYVADQLAASDFPHYRVAGIPTPEAIGVVLLEKISSPARPWRIPFTELLFQRFWHLYLDRKNAARKQ